jgi:hypothetical protein
MRTGLHRLGGCLLGVLLATAAISPPVPVHAAPDFELPAVQLRIGLDRALAEHAFLVVEAMRTGIDRGPEFEIVAEVVEENTVDILSLVERAYGAEVAEMFGHMWRNHVGYLVDYVRATTEGDEAGQAAADEQLSMHVDEFTALLADANPTLDDAVLEGLLDEHHQRQLEQISSLASADYADAYHAVRAAFAHMFEIGDALSAGILAQSADRFPGEATAFSPALEMRMTLDRLLGEHTYLAALAMRSGLEGAPDLDAAVAALGENADELAAQIGAIYGDDAGSAFGEMWGDHIDGYLAFVEAVAAEDAEAQQDARAALSAHESEFGAFLADANPMLDEDGLRALLEAHTDQLADQVARYRDGDFDAAYRTLREAYAHTEAMAGGLGGAIAEQFPERFPDVAMNPPPRPTGGQRQVIR